MAYPSPNAKRKVMAPPKAPDGYAVAPFDGIAEIWFDDMAGFLGVFASRTYDEIIKPNEMNFVDRSKALFMFTEVFPMMD